MKSHMFAALLLTLAGAPALAAADAQQGVASPQPEWPHAAAPQHASDAAVPPLPLPQGTKLVGTATVSEIREFPEEVRARGGERTVEAVQGVRGADRLYETRASYPSTVAFYDRALKGHGFAISRRTKAETATVWSLRRPDGSLARLAVRNTRPTTIEWLSARDEGSGNR